MKTAMLSAVTGAIVAGVDDNTVTVVDFDTPVSIIIETNSQTDKVLVVRRNLADSSWDPVTDGKGDVHLSSKRKDVTLTQPDTYAVQGYIRGVMTVYKVTV